MIFRVTLTHAVKGSIQIDEPDGFLDCIIGKERHERFFTVTKYFRSGFSFYGTNGIENGGREWIKEAEMDFGPDAIIDVLVEICLDDFGDTWEEFFDGEVAIGSLVEEVGTPIGHALDLGFTLKSFWTTLISRLETPVDIQSTTDLDGNTVDVLTPIDLPLPSQVIDMLAESYQADGLNFGILWPDDFTDPDFQVDVGTNDMVQMNVDTPVLDEVQQNNNIPLSIIADGALPAFEYNFEFDSFVEFDIKFTLTMLAIRTSTPETTRYYNMSGSFAPGSSDSDPIARGNLGIAAKIFIQFGDETPIELTRSDETREFAVVPLIASQRNNWSEYTFVGTHTFAKTEGFRIWTENTSNDWGYGNNTFTINIFQPWLLSRGDNNVELQPAYRLLYPGDIIQNDSDYPFYVPFGNPAGVDSYIKMTAHTTFPTSVAPGFLSHDLFAAVIKRISGAEFYSEVLGSQWTLARQYDYVGCAANIIHHRGLQLRGYTLAEKPFFQSLINVWDGVNPVQNLALGPDRIDGQDVIRVYKKEEVFDEDMCILLSNVRHITRSYDLEHFFNLFEIGYENWESEDISGIDDPQSKREYASTLKKLGQKISMLSKMIGASLAFETTRRMALKKSQDYKFDNETFILAVIHDESGFHPELSENFTDVSGLLNEETRYNKRLTSARNMLRWLNYVSGCLYAYTTTEWKFVNGEGNFDMQATLVADGCPGDFDGIPLSEKQNIPVGTIFLFLPILYTIEHDLTYSEWKIIDSNPTKAIGISQTAEGHKPFFTKDIQYQVYESLMILKAWPKEFFDIKVITGDEVEHEGGTGGIFDETFDETFE